MWAGGALGTEASTRPACQLQWHNDGFADSGNRFPNGLSLRKHSKLHGSLEETGGTPAFGKPLARWVFPRDQGFHYRESWAVGQNFQTLDDLEREDAILNDVLYVGMLGWSNALAAFDDERFTGFGFMLGWVGESPTRILWIPLSRIDDLTNAIAPAPVRAPTTPVLGDRRSSSCSTGKVRWFPGADPPNASK